MFYDMRYAGAVCRRRTECDVKYLIFIIIFQYQDTCMCLSMLQEIPHCMNVVQVLLFYQPILRQFFKIHLPSSIVFV